MWAELEAEVGAAVAAAVRDTLADRQLAALLGDAQWGDQALAVDGTFRELLSVQFRRRQQAVPVVAAGGAVCDPVRLRCCSVCNGCDRGCHMRCLVPALRGCLLVTGSAPSAPLPLRRHSCPPSRPPPATTDQVCRMPVWLAGCVLAGMAKLTCCCMTPVMGAFTCAALGCVGGVRLPAIGSARAALALILPLLATRPRREGPWRSRLGRVRYLL
jgi:hypothetical protein